MQRWIKCVSSHLSHPLPRFFSNQQNPPSSQELNFSPLFQKFHQSMKDCASVSIARKLHAQLISKGLNSSIFLQNNLLGKIGDAKKVFDEMPERDSVSWNSMMSAYFRNGDPEETVVNFVYLIRYSAFLANMLSFSCAMKACGALGYSNLAFQLHGLAEKFGFSSDLTIGDSVIDMYIKCGAVNYAEKVFLRIPNPSLFCINSMVYGYSRAYGVGKALDLFNRMPERDCVSWNMMVSILSQRGIGVPTLCIFVEMWTQGFRPNSMTYASVLSICTSFGYLEWGTHLHARVVRMEPVLDVYLGNGLINMYAKSGCLELAKRVFDSLTNRNAVSLTCLIDGIANCGFDEEALLLFNQMREVPVVFDEFTLVVILKICSHSNYISIGRQLQAFTIKTATDSFVPVGNALVTMYSKCGDIQSASLAFHFMPVRNIISWTSIITAFSQVGDVEKAEAFFEKMPERNVITWNSMIGMYTQHGLWEYGFKLYVQMQRECVMPDEITFATSISGCADLAMLKLGIQIVAQAEKLGCGSDVSVANSVVTMYSRCGQIEEAAKVFDTISVKDLVSWNSMMAGYAQNGQGRKVLEIFGNMLRLKCIPDHISYVSLLSGCSYSGLVTEGKHYFKSMSEDYSISPTDEHYSCMVDLLGRAGLLDEAKNLIDEMPFKPNADVWRAFLGSCKTHGNAELAEFALRNLLELDVHDNRSLILLAHIYSESGKAEGVADVRKLMKKRGIHKNPGCSWIEVDNRVHVFTVDETSHPQIKDIYSMLDAILYTLASECSDSKLLRVVAEYNS
ncbi:pentatricopeptide repeat-containing protein At2g13600 isoform X2 [Euphorbia lathyris]|uniref:pentatricopeptide repeat-containing protein At2g13600 isoform X2 n=1 Tax=Euphorbia lathyris TaxID=212925 RepID=UPI0033143DA4